jgi:hypothetical protein
VLGTLRLGQPFKIYIGELLNHSIGMDFNKDKDGTFNRAQLFY